MIPQFISMQRPTLPQGRWGWFGWKWVGGNNHDECSVYLQGVKNSLDTYF
jgi:hypothetical protein